MQRVDVALVSIKKEGITVSFYIKDWNYDDELENVKIAEKVTSEFAIGCFEIDVTDLNGEIENIEKIIEKTKKEIERLKKSKWNEEEALLYEEEYLEFLQSEKKKIEEAELVDEIVIEYSMCALNVKFNGKSVEINNDCGLLFKNIKLKIKIY